MGALARSCREMQDLSRIFSQVPVHPILSGFNSLLITALPWLATHTISMYLLLLLAAPMPREHPQPLTWMALIPRQMSLEDTLLSSKMAPLLSLVAQELFHKNIFS